MLHAYARLVGHWYRKTKTDVAANFENVARQKYGTTLVVYDESPAEAVPAEVIALLAPHRAPNL